MPRRHAHPGKESSKLYPVLIPARLLATVALAIDLYLAFVSLRNGSVAGCGPDSDCQAVLGSRWAYWFGFPVSAVAWLIYAVFLGSTFGLDPQKNHEQQRRAWALTWTSGSLILGAALWFVVLQLFVIRKICPYCMTAHACGSAAALLLLTKAPIGSSTKTRKPSELTEPLTVRAVIGLTTLALSALATLIIGQILKAPQTYVTQPIVTAIRTNVVAKPVREFEVYNGRFRLKLDDVPLLGRPDAPNVIVSLFDYTCHQCREMHGPILEAYRRFSNALAVVTLPMPLDATCNPVMKRTPPDHTNACALARIGLTVWRANRARSAEFDDWVFGPPRPPMPSEAERHARALVGAAAFDQAAADPWVAAQLSQDIALFETAAREFHKGYMPQVIIGTNLISGRFSQAQLFQVLSNQFGLGVPKPSPALP